MWADMHTFPLYWRQNGQTKPAGCKDAVSSISMFSILSLIHCNIKLGTH